MNSIHRARLEVTDYQEVEMTGEPISVAADRQGSSDHIDIWWEHNDETNRAGYEPTWHGVRAIYMFGTGHPTPWTRYTRYAYRHLGTIVTPGGFLVWHVYAGPKHGEPIAV